MKQAIFHLSFVPRNRNFLPWKAEVKIRWMSMKRRCWKPWCSGSCTRSHVMSSSSVDWAWPIATLGKAVGLKSEEMFSTDSSCLFAVIANSHENQKPVMRLLIGLEEKGWKRYPIICHWSLPDVCYSQLEVISMYDSKCAVSFYAQCKVPWACQLSL